MRSPRRLAVSAAVLVGGALLAPAVAEARWFDLHAGLHVGGITGGGKTAPGAVQRDFFELVRGPAAGFEVGAKLLGLDLSVRFSQVLAGHGEIGEPGDRTPGSGQGEVGEPGLPVDKPATGIDSGTLTQVMLGFEMEFPLASGALVLRPRVAGGLALGSLGPVSPPLGNDEISHKGFVAEGLVGLERPLGRVLAVSLQGIGGVHYLLGGTLVVNDARNWVQGFHAAALLSLVAHIGL